MSRTRNVSGIVAALRRTMAPRVAVAACVIAIGVASAGAAVSTPPPPAPRLASHPARTASAATRNTNILPKIDASTDKDSAVVRTLLAGNDARAAVADALATQSAANIAKSGADISGHAFAAYADGVRQLQRALAATRSASSAGAAKSARAQLVGVLDNVHARRLLVDARVEQIDRLVSAPAMPALARQRWLAHRATLVAALDKLDAAAQRSSSALAVVASQISLPSLTELDVLVAEESRSSASPTYAAATLPMYRPHLASIDPAMTPVVTPSYADAVNDDTPLAVDTAATDDAPLSASILVQAQSLGHDYTRIFDFVRSQVRTQWYAGAQKGADATLRTLAGNDVDQASLLIALLRASGAPARYVRGVLDVPVDDLATMLGVRTDAVGQALTAAGVPNRPLVTAGRISGFAIEQVIVSAYLPFSNYRGTAADLDGRAWLPLAPAIKPHALVPAAGALAHAGIVADDFVQQYLSAPQTAAPLDLLRSQISDRLSQLTPPLAYADQLGRLSVSAPPIELLPASLPVPVEAVTGEFAQLPETLRQHAHIVVRAGSAETDAIVFDRTFALEQLIDNRVTLAYQPASIDDGRIADQHGGLGATPPYLIHVRPVLNIAGLPAAAGTGEIENGATHRIEITLDGLAGTAVLAQQVTAGGIAALIFDAQDESPPEQADTAVLPGESESRAARLLANFGARYLSQWDQADDEFARLIGVGIVRPFPSVALVINQYRVDRIAGVSDALVWRGVGLDAALRPVEPFTQGANQSAAADWMELASLHGSVLEHQMFEQQWSVDSISADKGLALAYANSHPVLTLTAMTGTAGLNQPQAVVDDIAGWLTHGYVVDVPRDPLIYEDWSGAVWRVRSLSTGESGYFIAGALAGGSTAMPPELWYFQDLAALLANPYAQDPDADPRSGVALSIDSSAQYQDGVVNTVLAKPLRASVVDAGGRPVLGAQVQFSVTTGTAKLLDAGGAVTTAAIVTTDRNGVASIRVQLGTQQGDRGSYRIDPNKTYPQWIGTNLIEVAAASDVGVLTSGQPYTEYALPDVPSTLALIGDDQILLNPGISYSPYSAQVSDTYGNEVSNVSVALNASTHYTQSGCANTDNKHVDAIDATLFAPDQCPVQVAQLTGNACAQAAITTTTRPGGTPFFVVPPATALAQIDISGSAGSASAHLHLATNDNLFAGCGGGTVDSVVLWAHTPTHGLMPLLEDDLTLLDAAPLGQVMPEPQRIDALHADLVNGDHAGVVWQTVDNATFDPQLQNGSLENVHGIGGGGYLQNLRAGADPGPVHGAIYLQWQGTRIALHSVPLPSATSATNASDLVFAWAVDLHAPEVTPTRIPLTPFGATDTNIHLQSATLPETYVAAPVQIELLQGDEVIADCAIPIANRANSQCDLPRGVLVDITKTYSARTVLNDGNPFRFESARTPITFGQGIVGGYGMLPHAAATSGGSGPPDDPNADITNELALVQGRFPKALAVRDHVDVASGYTCTAGSPFGYLLEQDATVTLVFHQLDAQGNASPIAAWTALDHAAQSKGLQQISISSVDLPIGDYQYELTASANGNIEDYTGVASHHSERHDALPLAHPFVKGVDLYSGGAVISEEDFAIGGRGPGMKLTRTYASHQGDVRGFFGRGWSSDLDSQVLLDNCDTRIVTGAAGQGQRFKPASADADGTVRFTALSGYHGTLVQRGANYDFYAKDGTQYHYAQTDVRGPRLSFIQDTNGNRVAYTYEVNQGVPHVTRIDDAAGRHIDLTYTIKTVTTTQSGFTFDDSFTLVTDAAGPGSIKIHYDYDANGNLTQATRSDGSAGTRTHAYAYQDLGGQFVAEPDGAVPYYRFGWRLMQSTNVPDGATRSIAYQQGWSAVDTGDGKIQYEPEQRAITFTEPDGGVTGFAYPEVRGLTSVTADVTDARQHPTHYAMNRYGAAETITDPAGTTHTDWDLTQLQPHTITDALGTTTTYAYDASGNKTSETIVHAAGTIARSWTYAPSDQFTAPYIKDRTASATDGNGHATNYTYDANGNRTQSTRGGISEQDTYNANGDHASHTDGTGHIWLSRMDANGLPHESEDPLHHITTTTFDDRGRLLVQSDANGHTTTRTYDAQDRVLTTTLPVTAAGTGVQTSVYDDAGDKHTETNPNGHATVSTYDKMGRSTSVRRADGSSRTLTYDKNGNLTQETDFTGNVTKYTIDDANRRIKTDAPESRTTITGYDALGHIAAETVQSADGSDARTTEYAYAHPLYQRTLVRRHIDGATNADDSTAYDNVGNATQSTDALGRITTRTYDARNRQTEEDAPLGKITKTTYDDADRVTTQTLINPGGVDQTRTKEYDVAGRLSATIDATGHRRALDYDNTKNVIVRSDARGNLTHAVYDARDQLLSETGPVAGMVTSYTYDLAGNKKAETGANGNVRTNAFDVLERKTSTTDSIGPVEAMTYTPDGQIDTRTDANSHVTTTHYDGLHRVTQQDLPTVGAQTRKVSKIYNVHGDVLSETDPGGHTTTHTYDGLSRLITTTLPAVANAGTPLAFTYDLVGNLLTQTDARGNQTAFTYDDLNHKQTQTDPPTPDGSFAQTWTIDAVGNERSHTDRRGLVTTSTFDAENRPLTVMRDGLTTSTRTYDADGRVQTDTDALGRPTTNVYDEAGRRIEEDRPLGATKKWTYFPIGDVHTATDADGRTTTSTYTLRRYLDTSTNNAGETTTNQYDGEGHVTSTQRPMGAASTWVYAYDEADRLASVTDPLQHTTTYLYDADGNRLSQTDANGHKTTFVYDARHRRTSLIFPATVNGAASASWTYDPDGNVATHVTPNGRTRTFIVDALNRTQQESVDAPDPAEIAVVQTKHDGNGNVVEIDETLGAGIRKAFRHYDGFDRIDHDTDVHGKAVAYTYDAVGNRITLTDADGITTAWTFDALNHNTSVTVLGQGTTNLTYYPSGLIHTLTRPEQSTTTTEYDNAGRIATIVHAKGGSELAHENYRYDLNGNRIEQKEANGAVTNNGEQSTTYTYDAADRLTDTVTPDRTTHYVIDPVGNRTAEQIHNAANATIDDSTLTYDARDELTNRDDSALNLHIALTNDRDGNVQTQTDASGTRTFAYDAHDRLLTLTPQGTGAVPLTFDYQSDGLRLAKHQGSAETRYQYDQQSLLAETNAIGNTLARYHYSAGQLISRTETTTTPAYRHYLLDALNTPIALLTQDGAISARTKYDAWGEISAQQGIGGAIVVPNTDGANAELPNTDQQAIGFTGYLKDTESGLYYARARYYDPRIARFTTQDPDEGKAMQPPSLHRYLYGYVNPTTYTDPSGRIEELAAGADMMSTWNGWLRNLSGQQSDDALGHVISGGVGIGRGLLGLTEGAVRTVNIAANMYVVSNAPKITDPRYHDPFVENAEHELQGTAHALGQVMNYLDQGGANKMYEGAVDTTSRAMGGDNRALSDVGGALTSLVAPTRAAGITAEQAGNTARQLVADAATQARQAAQQVKNAIQSGVRIVEDSSGEIGVVPNSPITPGYNLERRMELIGDNDFRLEPMEARSGRLDYSHGFEEDLRNFEPGARYVAGPVQEETTLVQYHRADREIGKGRSAAWWTTTDQANIFSTIGDMQKGLALPPEWGPRNAVSVAKIPKGAEIEAFVGEAAAQPSLTMGILQGRAKQIRFKDFDEKWIVEKREIPDVSH